MVIYNNVESLLIFMVLMLFMVDEYLYITIMSMLVQTPQLNQTEKNIR